MFSNERKVQFFGLVQPQTKPECKVLEMFLVLHQNTLSVQCANLKSKKRSLLLTLVFIHELFLVCNAYWVALFALIS